MPGRAGRFVWGGGGGAAGGGAARGLQSPPPRGLSRSGGEGDSTRGGEDGRGEAREKRKTRFDKAKHVREQEVVVANKVLLKQQ